MIRDAWLCIDVGTSYVKASVHSCAGTRADVLATAIAPVAQVAQSRAHAYSAAADRAVQQLRVPPGYGVTHVVSTTFVQSLVGVAADGVVVRDGAPPLPLALLTYACTSPSACAEVDALSSRVDAAARHDRTGTPLHPAYAAPQIAAYSGPAPIAWCSLGAWLASSWTGANPLHVGFSTSEAAWSGMLDVHRRARTGGAWAWDDETCRALGLRPVVVDAEMDPPPHPTPGLLAPVMPSPTCLRVGSEGGHSSPSRLLGLLGGGVDDARAVRVWLSVGDGAAAAVGSGCLPSPRGGSADTVPPLYVFALTVGTSAALRTVISARQAGRTLCPGTCLAPPGGAAAGATAHTCATCGRLRLSSLGLWAYPFSDVSLPLHGEEGGGEEGGYILLGGALTDGGSLVETFAGNGFNATPAGADGRGGDAPVLPSLLTCLPFYSGERGTGWHSHARGSFVGLDHSTTPSDMLSAAMNAVAFCLRRVLDRLLLVLSAGGGGGVDRTCVRLVASGGGLHANTTWCRMIANALEVPLHVPPSPGPHTVDATTLGALLLGKLHWAAHADCPHEERRALVNAVVEHGEAVRGATSRAGAAPSTWLMHSPDAREGVARAWTAAGRRFDALYDALAPLHRELLAGEA